MFAFYCFAGECLSRFVSLQLLNLWRQAAQAMDNQTQEAVQAGIQETLASHQVWPALQYGHGSARDEDTLGAPPCRLSQTMLRRARHWHGRRRRPLGRKSERFVNHWLSPGILTIHFYGRNCEPCGYVAIVTALAVLLNFFSCQKMDAAAVRAPCHPPPNFESTKSTPLRPWSARSPNTRILYVCELTGESVLQC